MIPCTALAQQRVYTVAANDNKLREIAITSGQTMQTITLTLSGETITGATGLAYNTGTGELWSILKLQGQVGRELARIDVTTGICTGTGNTDDRFAGIAFDASGTLYGVTGDGADVPESLYTINTNNGRTTLLGALGDGKDGESLAFNADDGLLYHASGFPDGAFSCSNDDLTSCTPGSFDPLTNCSDAAATCDPAKVFQTVHPTTLVTMDIPRSGDAYGEGLGLSYKGGRVFLLSDLSPNLPPTPDEFFLYTITSGGVVTLQGELDHKAKGIALILAASECTLNGDCHDGFFCTGTESCFEGICQPGFDPCPGFFCDEAIDDCGCLVNSHCDDSDPCTSDTCSPPGSCNNDPIPDDDGDGLCNALDNCPEFWNPTQDAALFGQTIEVSICDSVFCLVWPTAVPMLAVRGDFILVGDIGTYLTNAETPPSVATAVLDGTVPAVGAGLWYLVQPDCPAPSWSSGGPGELPGARDASPNLP